MLVESVVEASAGEGAAVVGAERERLGLDAMGGDGVVDELDRLLGAAAELE